MNLSELITKLQAVQAVHGPDLRVLALNGEGGYDEHDWLGVAEFFPSGNKYAGGDWSIVHEWVAAPDPSKVSIAVYLDFSQSH